ncbi:MAG: hypothetical protein ABH804_00410 [archaeon]
MKKIFLLTALILLLAVPVFVSGEVSYCCEKTTSGDWCLNAPLEKCDDNFRKIPASCEATSYCRLGCCYNSREGTCMPNTPQKTCEDKGGVWDGNAECDIPQCSLGCCLIGDQTSFVTQVRCKRLSSLYGLETNFRTDITSEVMCILSAVSDVKGACVYEKEFEKTCEFITKKDCLEKIDEELGAEFHEGYLCSAESLGTNCGASKKTTCVEGKDEVYFVDTCGNLANIYDASKINSAEYWTKVYIKSDSCGSGSSNANSATCGNCDYYLGSTCKEYKRGTDRAPNYGDNICRDLGCEYKGVRYEHGETWCAGGEHGNEGVSVIISESEEVPDAKTENLPGSRYFRMICYNNEISVEPCADFRQEVCIESEVNGFSTAACRVNMWQDCSTQTTESDCGNTDRRDCMWKPVEIGGVVMNLSCFPKYSPGFNFWEAGGDAESTCSQSNSICVVKYEKQKGIFGVGEGNWNCIENCHCLGEGFKDSMNNVCTALGDCGVKVNYIGVEGYK